MHQQVRCFIKNATGVAPGGTLNDVSIVEILTLLKETNLRSAGRVRFDGGDDEFVFSVQHDKDDDIPDQEACNLLKGEHYDAEVYKVERVVLEHHGGTLLEHIQAFEEKGTGPVIEVYVGAAERNGKIPVQLVTRSMLRR
jgi:hypothetical protein